MTRSGTDSPRGPHRAGSLSPSPSDAVLDQGLVGVHADVGVDVVALGLADQRVQAGAGVMARPQQRLQAVDQGVFVGAVQRVAGLKGHDALPALFGQQLADLARREHVLAEPRVFRLRQHVDRAAQQMRLVGVGLEHHVAAGMVGPLGQIDAAQVFFLVPRIDVGNVEHGDDLAGRVDQRRLLAGPKPLGQRLGDRQGQGDRPGIELAVVLDHRFVEHAVVGGRIHRAGQAGSSRRRRGDRRSTGRRRRRALAAGFWRGRGNH